MNLFALDGLAGLVFDTVLKGTLYLALLLLANPLLRRLSAGTKHLIWGTALVALVALPFVSHFSPWRIGVLPAPETTRVENSTPARTEQPSPAVTLDSIRVERRGHGGAFSGRDRSAADHWAAGASRLQGRG